MNAEILKTLRATKLEFGNANGILFCLHYFTADVPRKMMVVPGRVKPLDREKEVKHLFNGYVFLKDFFKEICCWYLEFFIN